jgi:leucyl/phenylalanyl-tRNA---protein transferase
MGIMGIPSRSEAVPGGRLRRYIPPVAIFRLPRQPVFPDPSLSEPDGLLAVGGDLSEERLVRAYAEGIFPWYGPGSPILWWSPDPRMVLLPGELHLPRSLRRTLRSGRYQVRLDTAFDEVIRRCAERDRPGQDGTWITPAMVRAYERLHRRGLAHSAEAWEGGELAGGLYGVSLGGTFFGESMYADRPDASKAAFATLVGWLAARGFDLVDCQVETEHLRRFGAREIPREEFLERLRASLRRPTLPGPWSMDGAAG